MEEENSLSRILTDSIDEAVRFADLGAQFYTGLGLPEPKWPGAKGAGGSGGIYGGTGGITNSIITVTTAIAAAGSIGYWAVSHNHGSAADKSIPVVINESLSTQPEPPQLEETKKQANKMQVSTNPPSRHISRDIGDKVFIKVNLGSPTNLRIEVIDETQILIRVLTDGPHDAGTVRVPWDGKDSLGRTAPVGRYRIRIITPEGIQENSLEIKPKGETQ